MPDPRDWETPEPLPPLPETNGDFDSGDDGLNRRIGLGLVISILANVLLLQGAGVIKDRMDVAPPEPPAITVRMVAQASPTPSPEATPTPTPEPSKKAEPTPTPEPSKTEPTPVPKPTPEHATPTPPPVPTPMPEKPTPPPVAKVIPTPKPEVKPEKTPTPVIPTPTETVVKTQADAPAIATTARDVTALRSNNRPAMGQISAGGPKVIGLTARANAPAAATNFTVDASNIAPAPHVGDLPRQSVMGAISAAINSATSAKVQQNNTPDVQTSVNDRTTSQAVTRAGKMMVMTGRTNVITSRDPNAAASFAMPTGGNVAPGQAIAYQGQSARSSVAALSGSAPTTLATEGSQNVSVSVPGMHAGSGPAGVFRPGHMMSSTVAEMASEHTRGAPGGGTNLGAIGTGLTSGGNVREGIGVARGNTTAQYNPNAAYNTTLQGGGGPTVSVAAGHGTGTGVHMIGAGRRGALRGTSGGSVTGAIGSGGGGAGAVGLSNGDVGGTGNGKYTQAGARTGGVAGGIGSGSNVGFQASGNGPAVEAGSPERKQVKLTATSSTTDQKEDSGYGSAVNAEFSTPSGSSVRVPDSLRTTPYSTTVTVRVVITASGQVRATLVKSSGYPALDEEAVAACSRIRVKHPAMQDGKPVDETHTFNLNLVNQ